MSFWMGTDHQKDQAMIKSLQFSAPDLHTAERGEGLEMNLLIGHVYVRKPPQNPNNRRFGDVPGRRTHPPTERVGYPASWGQTLL